MAYQFIEGGREGREGGRGRERKGVNVSVRCHKAAAGAADLTYIQLVELLYEGGREGERERYRVEGGTEGKSEEESE